MEIATFVLELGKCLYAPLKRHGGYFWHYEKNVNELKSEEESLRTLRDDTNRRLDEERRSGRLPKQTVEVWKTGVENVVQDVQRLTEQMSTEEHKCLMGWCPNLSWRYRVGKSAAKKMDQVEKLKSEKNGLGDSLTYVPPPPIVVESRGDPIMPNEVGMTVMEQVMKALEDNNIKSIGIYGMGGIGKTTLVRDINNRMAMESTLFNKVIMVTVSQNPELKTIQDHIAEHLGMELKNTEINLRAHRLLEELHKQDRILIIFDDVWTELKVVQLGIPSKDEHRCCKIILTTRNRDVCRQMRMDAEFEMNPLTEQDSWNLFESKIGDVISNNPNLRPIGDDIVRDCKGSPLAIVTLGSLLAKKEEQYVWKDVLRRLRSSDPIELDGIMSVVMSSIKISYDYLYDERLKFCFLFCSLFPEDDDIDLWHLRVFGIGEGFLRVEGDLLQARVQLRSYIRSLKDCGLLLDGFSDNQVRMHDVVRDTARSIASKEGHGFIEKTRKGLRAWPKWENEEHCKQLSLMHNYEITALPDSPKFPQLRTLFLTACYRINHIPNNFFVGMSTLVNLDLSGIWLLALPRSISSLTSLRTLRLLPHDTWDVSSLRTLKNLEILILDGRVIVSVELAELTNLKVLSLKYVHLQLIPTNVLSKLHRLEELYLNTTQIFRRRRNGDAASLIEVASLNCLTVLEVNVSKEELLCPNISSRWSQLQEFKICFGVALGYNEFATMLNLDEKLPYPMPEWLICLIRKVEWLQLEWSPDLKNVLQLDTVRTLKHLKISNCSVIQHIANTEEAPLSNYALARLEGLRLVGLSSLEKICQGPLPERDCKGSPLAIVTLGSLLAKKEEQYVWKDVLRRLRSSDPIELDEDYDIDLWDLRVFGIREGFLRVEGDLLQAKVQLRACIRSLKDRGLLLDSFSDNQVRMHDVVRDTARSIASKEGHGFIEKTRKGLRDWPKLENEEHCKQLSLMHNYEIPALPDSPKFPQLRSLFLTHCYGIKHIPNNFFLGMSTLVNLDLSKAKLDMWPRSISCLTSLRTLRLVATNIQDMSSLKMLKNLEILILEGYFIVPVELAELSNLKVLCLQGVHLADIPTIVLSKLHRLEELYLNTMQSFSGKKRNDEVTNLIEVASLNCLTVLQVKVREGLLCPNISCRWGQLQEFNISFSNKIHDVGYVNTLILETKLPCPVPEWVICLIRKVEYLRLEWRPDLKNALQLDKVRTLKQLEILNCSVIQHIANTEEAPVSNYALERLEVLRLVGLSSLEKICQGPLPERCVMNLRVLRIENCGKLLNALPHDHLQAFQSLGYLYVKNCYAMTHVASTDDESSTLERNALEHLVELELVGMPNLIRIYDRPVPEGFMKKLKRLSLIRCGKLTNVFFRDLVHCIETIEGIDLNGIDEVDNIFDFSSSLTLPNALERLKYLSLERFKTLTVVFSGPRPSRLFPNLERFTIRNCPELVSIWSIDNNAPPERCHEVGDLCQLSNVVSNSDGPVHFGSFNHLQSLEIDGCGKLRSILSLLLAQSLQYLTVSNCERLEEVISNDELMTMHHSLTPKLALKATIFPNLMVISIDKCHNLKELFSFSMVQHGLKNLQVINLWDCSQLKAIIAKEDEEKEEVVPLESLFPALRILEIVNLPEILSFCSWERFLGPSSLKEMSIMNCPKLGKHHSLESLQQSGMPLVLFGNTLNLSPYLPMVLVPECNVQTLKVRDFREIEHVFWLEKRVAEGGGIMSTFSQLKDLHLCNLPKFENICVGSLPLGSFFQNLEILYVNTCKNLRYLLPLGLAQQLRNLERLSVKCCLSLEKLISDEEETAGWTMQGDVLPRLRDLKLEHLPELTSLYSGESFLQLPSLQRIEVAYCSKLKRLSLEPNTSPNLNEIYGEEEWLRGLEQEMHMEMKSHFKPLFRTRASMDFSMEFSTEEEEGTEEETEEETEESPE